MTGMVIRGWINYFALSSMKTTMNGIGKDLAKQTSYMGDHYQWIVTKTCVVRAISKEKLAQAGLISCHDYYMERHALKLC